MTATVHQFPRKETVHLTYKYRLLPSKRQHAELAAISEAQRQLYNAAIEERIDCYRKTGRQQSYYSQCNSLTQIRRDDIGGYGGIPRTVSTGTLLRVHRSFESFFRRIKSGERPGFPRFKSVEAWKGFAFSEMDGLRFDGKRIRFKGLSGSLRVHMHRPMPSGRIATCQVVRDNKGWSVCFQIEAEAPRKRTVECAVGIDVGLIAFAFLSDGVAIPAPQIARRAHKEIRRRQRALARCKCGSTRRKKIRLALTRSGAKVASARRTWLHQQSTRIVRSYDLIAVEDLQVANMLKNEHLARSISDASWSTFTTMLAYKAERAGAHFVKVDPKMTSQNCSGCGVTVRKGLADRVHNCPECGLVLDRDHNAALNILHRAVLRPSGGNVAGCGKRSRGNLKALTP